MKKLLRSDADRFAVAFADKLATYALRLGVGFADRAGLKHPAEDAKPGELKLGELVEAFAAGELFLKR